MGILRSTKHQLAYKLLRYLSDGVLTVSEEVRRVCLETEGVSPEKVVTIHNGIDLANADSARADDSSRAELGLDGALHIVTTVADIQESERTRHFHKSCGYRSATL